MIGRRLAASLTRDPRRPGGRRGVVLFDLLPDLAIVAVGCVGIWALIAFLPASSPSANVDRPGTDDRQTSAAAEGSSPSGPVFDMALLPKGRLLAAFGLGDLKSFDSKLTHQGAVFSTPGNLPGPQQGITRVATSPKAGDMLVVGRQDGSVLYWPHFDSNRHAPHVLATDHEFVMSAAIDGSAQWAATGGTDLTVRLWRLSDRTLVWTARTNQVAATSLVFSPDSRRLAWATQYGLSTAAVQDRLAVDTIPTTSLPDEVTALVFTADSRFLFLGHFHGQVTLWNVATRRAVWTSVENHQTVLSMALHPDGESLLVGHISGSLQMLDLTTGEAMGVVQAHRMGVRKLLVTQDGKRLITGGYDGRVRQWNCETMEEIL